MQKVRGGDNLMQCQDKARHAMVKGVSVERLWEGKFWQGKFGRLIRYGWLTESAVTATTTTTFNQL